MSRAKNIERADRIAANYREMHGLPEPTPLAETAALERIAAMMGEFVDNWPHPKRFETALTLIAKTLRASAATHDLHAACYAAYQRIDGEQYPDLIGPLHAALVKAKGGDPELHTITWSVKRMREMKSALQACEAYFEERADAEYFTDSPDPAGNEEMRLLVEVRQAIAGLPQVSA